MFYLLMIIATFGALGGVINALLTENGFILPRREINDVLSVIRPGFLVNVIIGAAAATISFGLYGPLAAEYLFSFGDATSAAKTGADIVKGITLSNAVGAILVGIGGAKWLTNEVDKKMLRGAGGTNENDANTARQIMTSSPAEAFRASK